MADEGPEGMLDRAPVVEAEGVDWPDWSESFRGRFRATVSSL